MGEIKNGTFVIYNGKEYQTGFWAKTPNMIRLASWNPKDLDNGFYCVKSQEYMKMYGFRCQKEVPKSEITAAYKIETFAKYRGKTYFVDRYIDSNLSSAVNREEMVRIYAPPTSKLNEVEKYNYYKQNGFMESPLPDYSDVFLYKYVSINDPELEIVETRTELNINEL